MNPTVWTRFFDLSSGGQEKTPYTTIWIEAPEEEAIEVFQEIFCLDPYNVTCECCGSDFSVWEAKPDFQNGEAIVSRADIERFRSGKALEHLKI